MCPATPSDPIVIDLVTPPAVDGACVVDLVTPPSVDMVAFATDADPAIEPVLLFDVNVPLALAGGPPLPTLFAYLADVLVPHSTRAGFYKLRGLLLERLMLGESVCASGTIGLFSGQSRAVPCVRVVPPCLAVLLILKMVIASAITLMSVSVCRI